MSGPLGLASPWTKAAFTPTDRADIEALIPNGYRIHVIADSPVRFQLLGMVEHDDPLQHPVELFRTTWTYHPVETAKAVVERLWLIAGPESADPNPEGDPTLNGAFR